MKLLLYSYAIEIGCKNKHNDDMFSNLSNQEKENTPNGEPNLTKMTGGRPKTSKLTI